MPSSLRLAVVAFTTFIVDMAAVGAPPMPAAANSAPVLAGAYYTADGELRRPADYRNWRFVSAGLGMSYGPAAQAAALTGHVMFDNVFVQPAAYQAYLDTGTWPEGTMFVLELRGTETKRAPNNGGYFQDVLHGIEVSVKDSRRFKGTWAYFDLGMSAASATPQPEANCYACHRQHAAVDMAFVQFYPTLQGTGHR